MKKNGAGKVILKIFLGLIIAVIVAAVAAYAVVKFYLVPKYTQKLAQSGREEIAEIVESNANLSTVPVLSSILSNKEVMGFLKGMNKNTARSVLDVLDILEQDVTENENNETEENAQGNSANEWQVGDFLATKSEELKQKKEQAKAELPVQEDKTGEHNLEAKGKSAYEKIAAAATAEEMADGLAIVSKLDISYILSLAADGITKEEKAELLKYMRTVLTNSEIKRAAELYRKYNKYL